MNVLNSNDRKRACQGSARETRHAGYWCKPHVNDHFDVVPHEEFYELRYPSTAITNADEIT